MSKRRIRRCYIYKISPCGIMLMSYTNLRKKRIFSYQAKDADFQPAEDAHL